MAYRTQWLRWGLAAPKEQAELMASLVNRVGRVWLVSDGDSAGDRLAESVLRQISPHRFVRWVKLDQDKTAD